MKIINKQEFAEATKLNKFYMPGLASLLMEIMKINEVNDVFEKAEHLQGMAFIDKILNIIGVSIEFDETELKHFPKEGGFIVVANHPYGGIEGLILLKIMSLVRPDSKLMANFLLKKIPNLSESFIAVNPFENIENSSSISGIKTTIQLLKSGVPIGIFPAGEVSTYKTKIQKVTDKPWNPVVGKLIEKVKVPVVPIYFHGNNGLLFNLLAMLHPTLRTAKLPSELFNKQGQTIKLRIGKAINPSKLPFNTNSAKLLDFVRAKTYALGSGLEDEKNIFSPKNLFKIKSTPETIIKELPVEVLEKEISKLEEQKICTEGNYEVYICSASGIPNLIKEIGRLREKTFREIGEGTNKAFDLDKYDINYHHLFIWDKESKLLVGAYRIGKGDELFFSSGKKGFYISELFKIKREFYPILNQSLELGRSWIRKEYQQKPLPLFLLWRGVLQFVSKNSNYKYLIGPVSISNIFSKLSKSLIVDFILKNNYDYELANYVKPRKKFRLDFSKIDKDLLNEAGETIQDLDTLISDIERSNMRFPVLLRKYLSLNAKIISFNIDPKFSDCLDGFMVLDLDSVPKELKAKVGGNLID
ncbi:GNAT family N-acyltransferase [Daejeonella sp.]|uniref:lysophospholipid acyltransferase family protein n=1 Tax=Daejeonella sp. TaxID=2805397 RepID=UPI0025BABF25|nr:GNAT family N-acyltransferase [Daejeonella sp.]